MSWDMINARKEAERKRPFNSQFKTLADYADSFEPNPELTMVNDLPERETVTSETALKQLGITRLSDLQTDHMAPSVGRKFNSQLDAIRKWRFNAGELSPRSVSGRGLVICSTQVGVGKTHIAKAVANSFGHLEYTPDLPFSWYDDGQQTFGFNDKGLVLTAREVMEMTREKFSVRSGITVLVLDDVGREGLLQFVKNDEGMQLNEMQSRYYTVVNYVYEQIKRGRELYLIITSNIEYSKLPTLFNKATWSRLQELAPIGCALEFRGVPDYRKVGSGR